MNPKCDTQNNLLKMGDCMIWNLYTLHWQTELTTEQVTYHEQASAPAPSTTDIHPISHEEFAKKKKEDILNSFDKKTKTIF